MCNAAGGSHPHALCACQGLWSLGVVQKMVLCCVSGGPGYRLLGEAGRRRRARGASDRSGRQARQRARQRARCDLCALGRGVLWCCSRLARAR